MYPILKKILFTLDPETAHLFAKYSSRLLPHSLIAKQTKISSPLLCSTLGDTQLNNPIGLAAGFDKNGEMTDFLSSLGFGFLELGSITALPCQGNSKPRIFRLPIDKSLINRMGLPNMGAEKFLEKMKRQKTRAPYGINIAKTPHFAQNAGQVKDGITDFLDSLKKLHTLGTYIVFNLSCPNSDEQHTFEDPALFCDFAKEIAAARKEFKITKPILLKFSPDLKTKALHQLVDTALKHDLDGFVLTNTTVSRSHLKTKQKTILSIGKGGLSGRPLRDLANQQLKRVYEIVRQKKILIGVGGIMTFEDVLEKFSCGASLVQVYTGFIYEGPLFIKRLNQKLLHFCLKEGVKSYQDFVGQKINALSAKK